MFFTNGNSDRCDVCRGNGTLRVVVMRGDWQPHKNLPRVDCDACNGTGRKPSASAAHAASQANLQQQ